VGGAKAENLNALAAGAAIDPSPAFQSREGGLRANALFVPALKSRDKLTWSRRDRERGSYIYFSKTINQRLNSNAATATGRLRRIKLCS